MVFLIVKTVKKATFLMNIAMSTPILANEIIFQPMPNLLLFVPWITSYGMVDSVNSKTVWTLKQFSAVSKWKGSLISNHSSNLR